MLTPLEIQKALPANLKSAATQSLADLVNNVVQDQIIAEQVRNNFISHTSVLKEGKFKMEDYLSAVTYVSFKLMGASNLDAYVKTFPQRYQSLVSKGTSSKDVAAYVAAYHKGKLVNLIMEQSLVPTWVLNADMHQKALNTQYELMTDPNVSPKVRSDAANSLLTHLAKPKEVGPLVNLDLRESSGMNELKSALVQLAKQQQDLISSGIPTKEVAGQIITDVEVK
jgi:hypothetical protein